MVTAAAVKPSPKQQQRPKSREVTSRYLSLSTSSSSSNSSASTNTTFSSSGSSSTTSSKRSPSPILTSRPTSTATPRSQLRSVSSERRRPATPSCAERKSVRSLSVSFQGESYSLPVRNKVTKPPPPSTAGGATPGAGLRKCTPEKRRNVAAGGGVITPVVRDRKDRENSKPPIITTDHHHQQHQQHRWPGRLRVDNSTFLTRSLDYGSSSPCSSPLHKELRKSIGDDIINNKSSNVATVSRFSRELNSRLNLNASFNSDVTSSTVSSDTTTLNNTMKLRVGGMPRTPVTSNRTTTLAGSGPVSSKLSIPKKFHNDTPLSSPRDAFGNTTTSTRGLSPLRGGIRPSSPSKPSFSNSSSPPREVFGTSTRGLSPLRGGMRPSSPSKSSFSNSSSSGALLRGMASPTRTRSGVGNSMNDCSNSMCGTPSMLSFANEARRGKFGENRIADAHDLRLLYNRQLQWRLANAKVESALLVQKHTAEKSLYNAWWTTSKLRHSVQSKKIEIQLLRLNLKLHSVLKEQEPHLESWDLLERDHCSSVSSAIVALEASTIRLPVVGGARADVQSVQEAISSAVDMMQAMASSVCSLLTKVEQMNLLVSELSNLSAREHRLLKECKDLLSTTLIPLQVMHCSLRTNIIQVQSIPESLAKEVR